MYVMDSIEYNIKSYPDICRKRKKKSYPSLRSDANNKYKQKSIKFFFFFKCKINKRE